MAYPGYYFNGQEEVDCTIIRMAARNSRIKLTDKSERVVESTLVRRADRIADVQRNLAELILPITPLEMFYRQLRKCQGSKQEKFESIRKLLCDRHGAAGAIFLAELFRRSVTQASSYRNVHEGFCPDREELTTEHDGYARNLVQHLGDGALVEVDDLAFSLVDFEIFPFRTSRSCTERGKPSTSVGGGGMDMLLAVNTDGGAVPAVGEIKANTEGVGPTFALIQSLMYASQIATFNQFERLTTQYSEAFRNLDKHNPSVEIIIVLQSVEECIPEDLVFAKEIGASMLNDAAPLQISAIRFIQCGDNEGYKWSNVPNNA